jgi:hypothetical protein
MQYKRQHLEGKKFGRLLVLKEMLVRSHRSIKWECLCDCGNTVYPTTTRLTQGKAHSCGRCTRKDLTGQRFGNLVVKKCLKLKSSCSNYYWLCECDCGKEIEVRGGSLTSGTTKSCGCLKILYKDRTIPAKKKLFRSYQIRAKNKNLKFTLSFEEFLNLTSHNCHYCGSPPSNKIEEGKTTKTFYVYSGIDRIDNTKGYIIENCVSCCSICNYAKTNLSVDKFIKWVQQLGKNLRLKGYG